MHKKIVVFLFLIIIFFFFFSGLILPDKEFSYNENRTLEQMPEISLNNILNGTFMNDYEKYVNDQIILRDDFVKLSTDIKLLMNQKEINGVYINNGYLVEKYYESDIDRDILNENISELQTFISNNSNTILALVPTAGAVIDGLYPEYSNNINQKDEIDKIYTLFSNSNTVDIYSELKKHNTEEIYYHTDHHWTTLGAYYGYHAICEKLGIIPTELNQYERVLVDNKFEGTIQSKINYHIGFDSIYKYVPKFNVEYTRVLNEDYKTLSTSLYDESKLKTKEKYGVFLGGNNAVVRITTKNRIEDRGKILIIKDSYSHCLIPFLANHYSEIVVLDLRHYIGGVEQFIKTNNGFDDILILYNFKNFAEATNMFLLNR